MQDNTALFSNAWQKADLFYEVSPDSLKEQIVLQDRTAPTSYVFQIQMQGVRAQKEPDGSIGFYDRKDGKKQWVIPNAIAWDSRLPDTPDSSPEVVPVRMDLKSSGNNTFVELSLDQDWLVDPNRVFPVIVDPTVTTPSATSSEKKHCGGFLGLS